MPRPSMLLLGRAACLRSGLICRIALLCLALAACALAQQSSFVFSYVLPTNLNVVPLSPGGTISFPATPSNGVSQAALNITNNGSVAASVTNVSISGGAFGLQGLPLFPVVVGAR